MSIKQLDRTTSLDIFKRSMLQNSMKSLLYYPTLLWTKVLFLLTENLLKFSLYFKKVTSLLQKITDLSHLHVSPVNCLNILFTAPLWTFWTVSIYSLLCNMDTNRIFPVNPNFLLLFETYRTVLTVLAREMLFFWTFQKPLTSLTINFSYQKLKRLSIMAPFQSGFPPSSLNLLLSTAVSLAQICLLWYTRDTLIFNLFKGKYVLTPFDLTAQNPKFFNLLGH